MEKLLNGLTSSKVINDLDNFCFFFFFVSVIHNIDEKQMYPVNSRLRGCVR